MTDHNHHHHQQQQQLKYGQKTAPIDKFWMESGVGGRVQRF